MVDKYIQHIPTVTQMNLESEKHLKSMTPLCEPVGSLPLIKIFPITIKKAITNARILIDHPHPRLLKADRNINGNITPPRLEPAMAVPVATPRFLWNQCATTDNAGVTSSELVTPPKTPRQRRKCQYFVHQLSSSNERK